MAKTEKQITGIAGERYACELLLEQGYIILQKNYRYKRAEVDIIASKADVLSFIEVKTRKNDDFGYPESFVSERQQELLGMASEEYVEEIKWEGFIRFDIIALTKSKNGYEVEMFEDAF